LPERCVEIISGCDLVVHAGDLMTEDALDELHAIGPRVEAVYGNMDSPELRERLPAETSIELPHTSLGLVHDAGPAAGRFERLRRRFPGAAAAVFGHSHMPLHESREGFQIFNPGSPTERRRAPRHAMGLARVHGGEIVFEHVFLDR
jgi:hypothetical protein